MSRVAIDGILVALAWAATTYKVAGLASRPQDQGRRALCAALASAAFGLTVGLPAVHARIDLLFGIPNIARLLKGCLAVYGGWSLQRYFIYLARDSTAEAGLSAKQAVRPSRWITIGTLGVLIFLFVLAPVDETEAGGFASRYAEKPFVLEYELVLLSYMGLTLFNVARHSLCYSKLMKHKPATHLGMWLVWVGGNISVLYVFQKTSYVIAYRLGLDYPGPNPELMSDLLKDATMVPLLVGSTLPKWGPYIGIPSLYRWIGQYRDCRCLYPLWIDLCHSIPGLTLLKPSSWIVDALNLRNTNFCLRRRVIEIQDAFLRLRPFIEPPAIEYARRRCSDLGLRGDEAEATVEAAGLAFALRARKMGRDPSETTSWSGKFGTTTIESDVAHLRMVAHCYKHSPIVREVVGRVTF